MIVYPKIIANNTIYWTRICHVVYVCSQNQHVQVVKRPLENKCRHIIYLLHMGRGNEKKKKNVSVILKVYMQEYAIIMYPWNRVDTTSLEK